MSLIPWLQFGGKSPKTLDPRLILEGKGQAAKNCRFDHGGVMPLSQDTTVNTPTKAGPLLSIFNYLEAWWLSWSSDVDVCLSPVANDSHKRIYYTEGGTFKATDETLATTGGTDYPHGSYLPTPPAPTTIVQATITTADYDYTQAYNQGTKVWQGSDQSFYFATTNVPAYVVPVYDPTKTYALKQVVNAGTGGWYDNYVCTTEITTPEAWNPAHWTLIVVPHGGATPLKYYLAPAVLDWLATQGLFQVVDPTTYVSINYTFTEVNSYGDEGAPAQASNVSETQQGGTLVTMGNVPFMLDGSIAVPLQITGAINPDAAYKVATIRIYRLNLDANGNEQYQFLMDVPLYDPTATYQPGVPCYVQNDKIYTCSTAITVPEAFNAAHWTAGVTDSILPAALGEVLQSEFWDAAPDGITGLISLPNAGMAAFVGNTLCFSVPGFPHAWRLDYQKTTDYQIMGLGSYGLSTIVLTQGEPYLVTSNGNPAASSMEAMKEGFGCLSKRSVVDLAGTLTYASTEGLTAIAPGKSNVMTKDLFTPEDWRAQYNPSTITGFHWEGQYLGFYDNGTGGAGFLFDPRTANFVDLDFFATGGYRDPVSGILYLVVGGNIVSFSTAAGFRGMDTKGKRYGFRPAAHSVIKVLAVPEGPSPFPVTVDVVYPPQEPWLPAGSTTTVTVTSEAPQRIAPVQCNNLEMRVYNASGGVSAVYLAETMEELPL